MSSGPAVGSTLGFEFPRPRCDAPDADPCSEAADTRPRSLRVPVADDSQTTQGIIQTLQHSLGHDVTVICDVAPAVAAAAGSAFDAILVGVIMPWMDGATATRDIRAPADHADGVPIIALTADVLFGKDQTYPSAGMTDYASKPIDAALLAEALRRARSHTNVVRSWASRGLPALSPTSRFTRGAVACPATLAKPAVLQPSSLRTRSPPACLHTGAPCSSHSSGARHRPCAWRRRRT